MKSNLNPIQFIVLLAAVLLYADNATAQKSNAKTSDSAVFNFKTGPQFWTVPAGVTSVHAEVYGAQGGSATGGKGGRVSSDLSVATGSKLTIYVGSQPSGPEGGENGGGKGCGKGTGGGGASDIRIGGANLTNRVLVAGGGGGAGYGGKGGAGGGLIGGEGTYDGSEAHFSKGGTQEAGGKGARAYFAKPGELGVGGEGINSTGQCTNGAMGGGGGGYYGGGGSGAGGGAGGSSYADTKVTSNVVHLQGVNEGNGRVVISWGR